MFVPSNAIASSPLSVGAPASARLYFRVMSHWGEGPAGRAVMTSPKFGLVTHMYWPSKAIAPNWLMSGLLVSSSGQVIGEPVGGNTATMSSYWYKTHMLVPSKAIAVGLL